MNHWITLLVRVSAESDEFPGMVILTLIRVPCLPSKFFKFPPSLPRFSRRRELRICILVLPYPQSQLSHLESRSSHPFHRQSSQYEIETCVGIIDPSNR